jgi:two-component system, NarL family, response regulator LiaR
VPRADIRVLLVDDSEPFRAALAELLQLADGYLLVGQAVSGEESLELSRALAPELVLMDLQLPGMDGLTAARHLRRAPQAPTVVLISTDVSDLDEAALVQAGALAARSKADVDLEWLAELRPVVPAPE